MSSVIVIMVDGLGASYLQSHLANLPNLARLAAGGSFVRRLAADVPATSLPGRTSILTGVAAAQHGIYGNVIFADSHFRYANPDDVRVPTLAQVGVEAGLDVAVVGYGMVRPEDATVFHHAWWANEMIQRARDLAPIPADRSWLRTSEFRDPTGRLAALVDRGFPAGIPDAYAGDRSHYYLSGVAADRTMMRWTAGLATADVAPDLVLTEILTPDYAQHAFGPDHAFSHASLGYADALLGTLVAELEAAGRMDGTTLVITSDHGHGPVDHALYTDRLLPGRLASAEGSVLFVAVDGERDANACDRILGEHGVTRLSGELLPNDVGDRLAVFVAPDKTSFERAPGENDPGAHPLAVRGASTYASMHGFRPGHPDDERFMIVHGPGVPVGAVSNARSEDVAATIAALVGLPIVGDGRALV